jgi:hypothetical protein
MSPKIFACWLTLLSAAALVAAVPVALFASDDYVDGEVLVRFRPGFVRYPADDRDVASIEDVEIADSALHDVLVELGVTEFAIVCKGWRHIDPDETYYDVQGEPLMRPLVDFTDVYLVRFEGATSEVDDALAEFATLSRQVVYAHPNWRLLFQTCGDEQLSINDPRFPQSGDDPGQWGFDNPGDYGNAVTDVDVNMPEGLYIQPYSTKKIGVIDEEFDSDHPDLQANFDAELSACFFTEDCADWDGGSEFGTHGTEMSGIIGALLNTRSVVVR